MAVDAQLGRLAAIERGLSGLQQRVATLEQVVRPASAMPAPSALEDNGLAYRNLNAARPPRVRPRARGTTARAPWSDVARTFARAT